MKKCVYVDRGSGGEEWGKIIYCGIKSCRKSINEYLNWKWDKGELGLKFELIT